ncbi:MAG TPA: hypothetical protein VMV31_03350 [Terriglobales bacterium]|nr:hypothetical protein [Terriglobales bacterium]
MSEPASPAEFRPTRRQLRLLEAAAAPPPPASVESLCKRAHIAPSTYYRWCKIPGFRERLNVAIGLDLSFITVPLMARLNQCLDRVSCFRAAFDFAFDPRSLALHDSLHGAESTYTGRSTSPVALARYAQRLLQRTAAAESRLPSGTRPAGSKAVGRKNESKTEVSGRGRENAHPPENRTANSFHAKMEGGGIAT